MIKWLDNTKLCLGWDQTDKRRLDEIRNWIDPITNDIIESCSRQVLAIKGNQSLLANTRFIQRLHTAIEEWLSGLLAGTFDDEHIKARWAFGRQLKDADLSIEDIFFIDSLVHMKVMELAFGQIKEQPETIVATMQTLKKASCLDMALIYNGHQQTRDANVEHALLDRFLAITGFSRTLYDSLAETKAWSDINTL